MSEGKKNVILPMLRGHQEVSRNNMITWSHDYHTPFHDNDDVKQENVTNILTHLRPAIKYRSMLASEVAPSQVYIDRCAG